MARYIRQIQYEFYEQALYTVFPILFLQVCETYQVLLLLGVNNKIRQQYKHQHLMEVQSVLMLCILLLIGFSNHSSFSLPLFAIN